jgi:hypothetical protein
MKSVERKGEGRGEEVNEKGRREEERTKKEKGRRKAGRRARGRRRIGQRRKRRGGGDIERN